MSAANDPDGSNETVTISHTIDTDATTDTRYNTLTNIASVTVRVTDDDEVPGVTITPTDGTTTVTEGATAGETGASDTYTIELDSQPASPVVITVTNPDSAALTVDTNANTPGVQTTPLTFMTENWSTPQTVTVFPADDPDIHDESLMLTHAITTAAGAEYPTTLPIAGVTVMVTDDDEITASLTIAAENRQITEPAGDAGSPENPPGVIVIPVSISISNTMNSPLTVLIDLGGNATLGTPYVARPGGGSSTSATGDYYVSDLGGSGATGRMVTVAADATTASFMIHVHSDPTDEDDQTIEVSLAATGDTADYLRGANHSATITISDNNDDMTTLAIQSNWWPVIHDEMTGSAWQNTAQIAVTSTASTDRTEIPVLINVTTTGTLTEGMAAGDDYTITTNLMRADDMASTHTHTIAAPATFMIMSSPLDTIMGATDPTVTFTLVTNPMDTYTVSDASSVTITFNATLTDATLSTLSLSEGTLSPSLDPAMLTGYTANVGTATSLTVTATPADSAATITVNGTQTDGTTLTISGTTSPFTVAGLTVGTNTITVQVTSEDSTVTQDYVMTVVRGSTDATLSALSLSPGTLSPSFDSTTTAYTANVVAATNSLMVTATPANSAATITVSGTQTDGNTPLTISGTTSPFTVAGLTDGANTITVRVTPEAGTTMQDYVVTVDRESDNATLSALSLSAGTLSPSLDPAMLTGYTANVGTATSLMVTATPANSAATITVSGTQADGNTPLTISGTTSPFTVAGLTDGANTITVTVTAEAGNTQDYVVTVGRGSTDATLSALSLSPGTLSPSFDSTTTAYTVDVGTATNSLMVTATPADNAATITVSGTQTDGNTPLTISGTTSPFTVAGLTDGANTITVRVTSEAGTTMQDYVVTARKGFPDLVNIVNSLDDINGFLLSLNVPISDTFAFTNRGDPATSCAINPALPSGAQVTLQSGTCVITGTPTAAVARTTYTVTARNAAGASTATVQIEFRTARPSLSDLGSVRLTQNVAISGDTATALTFPNNGGPVDSNYGGGCRIRSATPALPSGLTVVVQGNTCAITGTPEATSVSRQYTVTGENFSGDTSGRVTITVVAPS